MAEHSWHDLQYLPSLTVDNAVAVAPVWRKRAALTRENHPPEGDIKYGSHPRENLDLFRVRNACGTVVYIHGGYWRAFSKLETSWIADGFLSQGLNVALVNYPLCPDVNVAHIRQSCIRAFAWLWRHVLSETERQRIVVTGHSAGGHLAAHHLTVDWRHHNLPENPIVGVLPISGIFDLEPLRHTSLNADLRLTPESVPQLNLMTTRPRSSSKLVFAVGADEPSEFHRQSHDQAKAWASLHPKVLGLPGQNHFTVINSLADSQGILNREVINMLGR